jgi:hypothetical protein
MKVYFWTFSSIKPKKILDLKLYTYLQTRPVTYWNDMHANTGRPGATLRPSTVIASLDTGTIVAVNASYVARTPP